MSVSSRRREAQGTACGAGAAPGIKMLADATVEGREVDSVWCTVAAAPAVQQRAAMALRQRAAAAQVIVRCRW